MSEIIPKPINDFWNPVINGETFIDFQDYCKKEEKDNWGCKYFIKDFYRSLNPHEYWAGGKKNVTCFNENKSFRKGTITYPFKCEKLSKKHNLIKNY